MIFFFFLKIASYEMFHRTLITCSVEIVIYAYMMAQKKFPWILECFSLEAYNFYKIIEPIALYHKDILTRDVIKHLNAVSISYCVSLKKSSLKFNKLWFFFVKISD